MSRLSAFVRLGDLKVSAGLIDKQFPRAGKWHIRGLFHDGEGAFPERDALRAVAPTAALGRLVVTRSLPRGARMEGW